MPRGYVQSSASFVAAFFAMASARTPADGAPLLPLEPAAAAAAPAATLAASALAASVVTWRAAFCASRAAFSASIRLIVSSMLFAAAAESCSRSLAFSTLSASAASCAARSDAMNSVNLIWHRERGLGFNVLSAGSRPCRLWRVVGRGRGSSLIEGKAREGALGIAGLRSLLISFLD